MVKVKMAEVTHNQKDFNQKARQVQDGLTAVSKSMIAVPNTPGFSGEAKRSMASYTDRIHKSTNQDLINNISELKSQYQKTIQMFKGEVDSSEDAILDSNYIQEISGRVKQQRSPLEEALNTCNKGVSQAAGIVAVTHLDHEAVQNLEQTCRSAKQTISKLEQFNQKKPSVAMENLSKQVVEDGPVLAQIRKEQVDTYLWNQMKDILTSDWAKRIKMIMKSGPDAAFIYKKLTPVIKAILNAIKAFHYKHPKLVLLEATELLVLTLKYGPTYDYILPNLRDLKTSLKFTKYLPDVFPDILEGKFFYVGKSILKDLDAVKNSPIGKLGKGKLFALDTVVNVGVDWADDKQHNLGHAVSDGVIDSIFDIGPVTGAMAGATIGPVGAGIGAILGSGIQIYKFLNPKAPDNAKTFAHQVEDKINSKIGKAVRDIKWENIYPVPYYPNLN